MKVVGILRVKDEADLLPSVLANVEHGVDAIYAYEDDSSDNTLEILQAHPKVEYIKTFDPSFTQEVHKTHHLEQMVKQNFPYKTEEVWVALLAGDLYWLNQTPREAAHLTEVLGHDLRTGCALNFSLHHSESWEGKDEWPNWSTPLRQLCRWAKVIEELPVVWKVADYTRWKRLPWPGGFRSRATTIVPEMPFLEHQGKRSPKFMQHRLLRDPEGKFPPGMTLEDAQDLAKVDAWGRSKGYWCNPESVPWLGLPTIKTLLEIEKAPDRSVIYRKWEEWYEQQGRVLPPRTDL